MANYKSVMDLMESIVGITRDSSSDGTEYHILKIVEDKPHILFDGCAPYVKFIAEELEFYNVLHDIAEDLSLKNRQLNSGIEAVIEIREKGRVYLGGHFKVRNYNEEVIKQSLRIVEENRLMFWHTVEGYFSEYKDMQK